MPLRKNDSRFGEYRVSLMSPDHEALIMAPHSLFSLNDRLEALSQHGGPLEVLERTVDFEYFRDWLVGGVRTAVEN